MTPMQILKNNFQCLKDKLTNFEEINLNKSPSKNICLQNVNDEYLLSFPDEDTNFSYHIKKGVKSDFIKLFKTKTKKEKYSIGFHFKYIDVAEPEIQCSIKEGENFFITEPMSLELFKDKLNILNNLLTNDNTLENINKIKTIFNNTNDNVKKMKLK